MDWNRYAYVRYNPLAYVDPSGHSSICFEDGYCIEGKYSSDNHLSYLSSQYGVKFSGTGWVEKNKWAVITGVQALAYSLNQNIKYATPEIAFREVFGIKEKESFDFEWGCPGCSAYGLTVSTRHVKFRTMYSDEFQNTTLVVHELIHAFENAMEIVRKDGTRYKEARSSLPSNLSSNRNGLALPHWKWQQSDEITPGEIFADMGIGWIFGKWSEDPLTIDEANERSAWMNENMPRFIESALRKQKQR
jgi:hypothetical protein